MSRRIREACADYDRLTNGETLLAPLKALNLVAIDASAGLAGQRVEHGDFDDEGNFAA